MPAAKIFKTFVDQVPHTEKGQIVFADTDLSGFYLIVGMRTKTYADLYKLLFRDLSTGGIIRQHRERDYYGNAIAKTPDRKPKGSGLNQQYLRLITKSKMN